jgi:hypothetical protein
MEISSLPFIEDCPSLLSFVQDSNPGAISSSTARKRPRSDSVETDSSFEEFMTKFLAFDGPPEGKRAQNLYSAEHPSVLIGSNPEMDECSYYFNGHPNLTDSSNSLPAKRARSEADDPATTSADSANVAHGGPQRRLWVKTRSSAWWEQVNSPDFPEEEFKKAFRMSRATFDMICGELESVVTKKDTMLRTAIPVRQRVAVCVWRLATGEALREVSKRFGLGISTCHKLVLEVCSAIRNVLMPKFLQWPNENRMQEIKREFESFSGIPDVGGSIYTTHIPIIAPKVNVGAYFNKRHTERNQRTSYSVTVQGVVDPKGVFTDICIGWPGSMTDDQVLEKSALFQRASRGVLKDFRVIGNSGYPLMDWVLVPYANKSLTWAQHAYNEKVEEVQRVAKESFMRLKSRWSCLQKRTDMKLQDLPVVLAACCVLHNICEMRSEGLSPDMRFELFDDGMIPDDGVRSVHAMHARDRIAHKLLHHDFEGSNFLL